MNTFNLTLDLNKSRSANPVRIRQGDVQGTTITALILDHGATADLTGYTAQFVMDLPDGTHYYRKAASISGNTVTVTIDETQAASVTGRTALAYVQLLRGSTVKASTGCVTVEVLPDALDGKAVPESYDSAIQDAIDALDAAVADMPDMVEDVLEAHPEWTTTVQDGSITKAKLATDLALDRERLLYRLANMLTATLPEGETATATDAAKTPVAGLALYGRSTQDGTPTPSAPVAIQSVGAANLVNIAAHHVASQVTLQRIALPAGTYTILSDVTNGGSVTAYISVYDGNNSLIARTSFNAGASAVSSATFTLASAMSISIRANGSASGYSFDVNAIALYRGSTAYPYVPYGNAGLWARRTSDASTYTVTPIDLDGHELRSLPDGTRDELTVDARGHAVLVQRVGSVTLDGSSDEVWSQRVPNSGDYLMKGFGGAEFNAIVGRPIASGYPARCTRLARHESGVFSNMPDNAFMLGVSTLSGTTDYLVVRVNAYTTLADFKAWLAANPMTLDYPLATPQTIDLGTIEPVPLVGPDLTAQAVPTAPFALTYERDLDVTLARLESAIATLA